MASGKREVLNFLRDFETSTRNYLLSQGVADSELPAVLLEAQWQMLHNILQSKLAVNKRQQNFRHVIRHKPF